jgi:hypothetical protein
MFDPATTSAKRAAGAKRARKSRRQRRNGLRSYRVYLPEDLVNAAVQKRENLENVIPSERQIKRSLADGFNWWISMWAALPRHK